MVWVMLDDKFHGHRKVLALFDGPCAADAIALWTLGASWCGDQLTDGVLPAAFVKRSGLDKRAAPELVRVGLWELVDGGFRYHEWLERNRSREQVLADRAKSKKRVQKHRGKAVTNAERNGVTDPVDNAGRARSPTRSRPDPDQETHAARVSDAREEPHVERDEGPDEPDSDRPFAELVRLSFGRRYSARLAGAAVPETATNARAFASVTAWVEATSSVRGVSAESLLERLLDGFFASERARKVGRFSPTWLAQDPLEWIEPQAESDAERRERAHRERVAADNARIAEQLRREERERQSA